MYSILQKTTSKQRIQHAGPQSLPHTYIVYVDTHMHARTHTHRQHAVTYYNQAASHEKLGDYYYVMEEYSRLEQLADDLPDIHCLR